VHADSERDGIDPWAKFPDLNERLTEHFRNISENPRLGSSHLLFYLNQAMQFICSSYLRQMLEARKSRPQSLEGC